MNSTSFILLSGSLIITLAACGKQFKSPPAYFEMWQKPGASELDTKIAVLECGYQTPYSGFEEDRDINKRALRQLCMLKNGFIYEPRSITFCRSSPNLDACKPENAGAIPDRDISRRLNAPFCKQSAHSNFPECK